MNSLGNWNNPYASLRNFQDTPSVLGRVWISLPKIWKSLGCPVLGASPHESDPHGISDVATSVEKL